MSQKSNYVEDIETQHKRQETVQVSKELGSMIQKARLAMKKNLEDVSSSLKIQVKYLEAIEAGDSSKMPNSFYYLSFVKSYIAYLKLDAKDMYEQLRSYYRDIGVYTGNSLNILMQSRYNKQSFSLLLSFGVLFVIMTTFALVYFFSQNIPIIQKQKISSSESVDTGGNQIMIVASEKSFVKLVNSFDEVIFSGYLDKNETKTFYSYSGMTLNTEDLKNLTIFLNGVPLSNTDIDFDQDNNITILRGPVLVKTD